MIGQASSLSIFNDLAIRRVRDKTTYKTGVITVDNKNGTYNLLLEGSTEDIVNVPAILNQNFQVGGSCNVFYAYGLSSFPVIVGTPSFETPDADAEVNINPLLSYNIKRYSPHGIYKGKFFPSLFPIFCTINEGVLYVSIYCGGAIHVLIQKFSLNTYDFIEEENIYDYHSGYFAITPDKYYFTVHQEEVNKVQWFNRTTLEFISSFTLTHPGGIVFSASSNFIYVANSLYNINVYDLSGVLQFSFGGIGTADGKFSTPTSISLYDNYIYASDSGRVQVFDLNGNFVKKYSLPGIVFGDIAVSSTFLFSTSGKKIYRGLKTGNTLSLLFSVRENLWSIKYNETKEELLLMCV